MGVPAYIAVNLAADAVSIDLVNELDATVYPASYANDEILATVTKFDGTGGNLIVNVNNSPFISYNSVFIGNHNLSSGAAITLKVGTNLGAMSSLGLQTWRADNVWYAITNQTVNNYLQIDVSDTTLDDQIEIGEVVIGTRVLLPRAPTWGIVKQQANKGITEETLGGVTWDYELSHYKIFQPTFRFPESEYASFLAFSDAVGRDPFVYIPNIDSSEAYYVKKDRGFDPRPIGAGMDGSAVAHWYDWTPTLRCQSEGLTVNG